MSGETQEVDSKVVPSEADTRGRYLYCVADNSQETNLGSIGIDGNNVYTIPYQDISAVVHNCPAQPYESKDNKVVEDWVMAHETVVETARERLGTVLPLGFDTIIKAGEERDPEEMVKDWLKEEHQRLKEKLDKVKGKVEYGVQISWDAKIVSEKLIEKDQELKDLGREIKSKPKGAAYMYKQKLEKLMREKIGKEAEICFKDFYEMIKGVTDEIKVEKLKKEEKPGRQMLMNLSCLTDKDDKVLGNELGKINNTEGFFVRFTGPWPPYSFV